MIPEWVENHGFPKRGTFSITALNRVKESLEKCEKLRDKKKKKKEKQTGKGRLTTETFAAETEEGGGSQEQSPRRPSSTNR